MKNWNLKLSDMFFEKVEKIVLGLHIIGPCHSRKLVKRYSKLQPRYVPGLEARGANGRV
jgi:hypothetical protein